MSSDIDPMINVWCEIVNICVQLLNSLLAEEKLGIDGLGALFPVSQVLLKKYLFIHSFILSLKHVYYNIMYLTLPLTYSVTCCVLNPIPKSDAFVS